MKIPNYLTNSFAIVGVISLIIMACSADNSTNTNSVNAAGKYQITSSPSTNYGKFHVIDTETGVVKTFETNSAAGNYVLLSTTVTQ
jgi:hypothetical protein